MILPLDRYSLPAQVKVSSLLSLPSDPSASQLQLPGEIGIIIHCALPWQ